MVCVAEKGFAPIIHSNRPVAVLLGLFFSFHTPAQADCVRLQPLAALHDSYRALLSENAPHTKAIAANNLLKFVPIYSAQSFESTFTDMALNIDIARLDKVLVDAFFLGRDALAGGLIQHNIPAYHFSNADWLSSTIFRTGCFRENSPTNGRATTSQFVAEDGTHKGHAAPTKSRIPNKGPQKGIVIGALVGILSILLASMIYKSFPFRVKRVQRLPRHAVAFPASADFEKTTSRIIVLDVSAGGAKIECDHPPTAKESITLNLPCGSVPATIVWATAFYAGVMFDKHLSKADLQTILTDEKITTRSRLSNVF